eukprot:164693-Rhodomonas_salina.1
MVLRQASFNIYDSLKCRNDGTVQPPPPAYARARRCPVLSTGVAYRPSIWAVLTYFMMLPEPLSASASDPR